MKKFNPGDVVLDSNKVIFVIKEKDDKDGMSVGVDCFGYQHSIHGDDSKIATSTDIRDAFNKMTDSEVLGFFGNIANQYRITHKLAQQ